MEFRQKILDYLKLEDIKEDELEKEQLSKMPARMDDDLSDDEDISEYKLKDKFYCFYLGCRINGVKFNNLNDLNTHKQEFHYKTEFQINAPEEEEINLSKVKKVLNRFKGSGKGFCNYAIAFNNLADIRYLGMSCNANQRPFVTLIEAYIIFKLKIMNSFKYHEICRGFEANTKIFILRFNKQLNRKQSMATETACLLQSKTSSDDFLINLVNIYEVSASFKFLNEGEITQLKNYVKFNILNCDDIEETNLDQLECKSKEFIDFMGLDLDKLNERDILTSIGKLKYNVISSLSLQNKIVTVQILKESKTRVNLQPEFRFRIIKKLTEYDLPNNDPVILLVHFYKDHSEEKLNELLDFYRLYLDDDVQFDNLIKETTKSYDELLEENTCDLYFRLYKRISTNIALELKFDPFVTKEFLEKVCKYVSQEDYDRYIKNEMMKPASLVLSKIKNYKYDGMYTYIVNVFDYLKIDLERRNDILSKFADAFEIYLQESVAYLTSRLYLITIFNINKYDYETISIKRESLESCVKSLTSIDDEELKRFLNVFEHTHYEYMSDYFDKEIGNIFTFINDLNPKTVATECRNAFESQYKLDHGDIPSSFIHLYLENDSKFKKVQKFLIWYNLNYEKSTGNKLLINDIYNHYVSDIKTGEPLIIGHTSSSLKKNVEYLDIRKSSALEYDQLGKKELVSIIRVFNCKRKA